MPVNTYKTIVAVESDTSYGNLSEVIHLNGGMLRGISTVEGDPSYDTIEVHVSNDGVTWKPLLVTSGPAYLATHAITDASILVPPATPIQGFEYVRLRLLSSGIGITPDPGLALTLWWTRGKSRAKPRKRSVPLDVATGYTYPIALDGGQFLYYWPQDLNIDSYGAVNLQVGNALGQWFTIGLPDTGAATNLSSGDLDFPTTCVVAAGGFNYMRLKFNDFVAGDPDRPVHIVVAWMDV